MSKYTRIMDSFAKFRAGTYPKKVVTIKTKDGNSYSQEMDCHPGHPANMMSREEFIDTIGGSSKIIDTLLQNVPIVIHSKDTLQDCYNKYLINES